MRAWAAGLIVLFISEYVQVTYYYETFASVDRLESFGGRLLLVHLPNAVCVALTAWIAGRLHREPFRDSMPRHLAAVFGVPLFAEVVTIVMHLGRASLEGFLMSCVVVVVGAVTGYAVDRLQEGER
ncbi:hypothetical protein [Streptomyces sp. NPDC050164]|uniref:hypothetical protein n=1 Tax=Streptomyces sp. NPDC050164 TaxID=3365605 RepID=UPI0037BD82B4